MGSRGKKGVRSVAGALWQHVERAIAARIPVLEGVMSLSEEEVLRTASIVQNINAQSRAALQDLEVVAACLLATSNQATGSNLGTSIAQQALAYQRFVGFCGTTEQKLNVQEGLAGKAVASVKRMLNIVGEVDAIAQRACITTFNARIEAAHMGAAGRTFDVIADELRDMTAAVQGLNVQIKTIGEELMKVIPVMASEAGALRQSHAEIARSVGEQMAKVGESQRSALDVLNGAVLAGRTRTDDIVEQSHEVMARLTFQDRISQDISALIKQELASGELLDRSLRAIDTETPADPAEIEREGRAIEVIRHGKPGPGDVAGDASDDDVSVDASPAGEMTFF
jgi:hypothetical protein